MAKPKARSPAIKVRKLGKHGWGISLRWAKHREMIDGFDSKAEAQAYAQRAPDFIALQSGQGR